MTTEVMPALTQSVAQALQDLEKFGLALLSDQLTPSQLLLARQATYAAVDEDGEKGRFQGFALDYGDANIRVWNILNRHGVFRDLVQIPQVVELLTAVLGWPALLGNISANITQPGGTGGALHADQLFMPTPWPVRAQGMNVAWCLDDFTQTNGATQIVPFSHLRSANADQAAISEAMPVIAPAGTMMLLDSRLWHRTGENTSQQSRAALFGWYTRPIYRTQENWFLSLDSAIVDTASDTLLTLLGYKSQGLGLVYGQSPR